MGEQDVRETKSHKATENELDEWRRYMSVSQPMIAVCNTAT